MYTIENIIGLIPGINNKRLKVLCNTLLNQLTEWITAAIPWVIASLTNTIASITQEILILYLP